MDRREFLAKAGLVATWAGVAVRVGGCGGDDTMSPDTGGSGGGTGGGGGGTGGGSDVAGAICSNHGHATTAVAVRRRAGTAGGRAASRATLRGAFLVASPSSKKAKVAAQRAAGTTHWLAPHLRGHWIWVVRVQAGLSGK